MKWVLPWVFATGILLLRLTTRVQFHNDPRQQLRRDGRRYVFSLLHAHLISATMGTEKGVGVMVSRSADGEIVIPAITFCGCVPVRGSGRHRGSDKGGRTALAALVDHVVQGRPALLSVDGPRGPRGKVHKGIAHLGREAQAVVIPVAAIARRRWILHRSWDRIQIPKPFSVIELHMGQPLMSMPGERLEMFRRRIEVAQGEMERRLDPQEAHHSVAPADYEAARAA